MNVLGIDPGTSVSAVVVYDGTRVVSHAIQPNQVLVDRLHDGYLTPTTTILAIEQIESMGMAVGASVFETVFWSGRMVQAWSPGRWERVTRRQVKLHLCGTMRAKDKNIRQALLDRFGGREKALGTKKAPGPLYGVSSHCWSALAVAVTFYDAEQARQDFKGAR